MFVTFTHADDGRLETVAIDRIVSIMESEPDGPPPATSPDGPAAGCEVTVAGRVDRIVTTETHDTITKRLVDAMRHYRGRRCSLSPWRRAAVWP